MVTTLHRLSGWRARLARYLAAEQDRPIEWGASDCALFAAGGIEAVTGVDLATDWRGSYAAAEDAARVLRSLGCRTVADLADLYLPRHDRQAQARPGDVVLIDEGALGSLGISVGPAVRVRGTESIGTLPLSVVAAAWRVG